MNEHKHIFINFHLNKRRIRFCVFDYDHYENEEIHNEGLDIISKCIKQKNCWGKKESEVIIEILKGGGHLFIDLGCHIGYYSVLASLYGNKVIAVDINKNYLECLHKTAMENYMNNIRIKRIDINSIDKRTEITKRSKIRCVKISLNGNELIALSMFKHMLKQKNIDYLIVNYKKGTEGFVFFMKVIAGFGYKIHDIGLSNNDPINEGSGHLSKLEQYEIKKEDIPKYFKDLKAKETTLLLVNGSL